MMSQKNLLQLHVHSGQYLRASSFLHCPRIEFAKQVTSRLAAIAHNNRLPHLFFSPASARVSQVCQMLMNL